MKTNIFILFSIIGLFSCVKKQDDAFSPHTLLEINPESSNGIADNESYLKITVKIKNIAQDINTVPPNKRKVTFATTLGTFKNATEVLADGQGNCVNYLKSSTAGTAIVTATLEGYKVTTEITFSEPVPSQFIDTNSISGPDSVVADGFTVLINRIKYKTGELTEKEFRLDSGKFSNNTGSIKALPDASGTYTLHIRADRPGTDRLQVVINNKVYLLRLLTYTPALPVGSTSYAGPDSLPADGITFINAAVTLNTANKPQRKFILQKGRFDNDKTEVDVMPDAVGIYYLRIKSGETGTDNLTVQAGGVNYLVKILTYTSLQPVDANSYKGPASVVADNVTYIDADITLNATGTPQRTFTLQKGTFEDGTKSINVLPGGTGSYHLRIKSAVAGTDNLMVHVGSQVYLVKNLTYTTFSPVGAGSYSGPDNVQADGVSFITAVISLNTADKPQLTFTLQKGTFDDGTKSINVLPDGTGNYTVRIKSQVLGTDNLTLVMGSQNWLVKPLTYIPSLPDGIRVEVMGSNPTVEYEAFKTVTVKATLTKSYGIINLAMPLSISLAATNSSGNPIGYLINAAFNPDKTVYTQEFYLTDTTYTGFINFKATESTIPLNDEKVVYFKPK